ncbi:hypothetical protein J5N97_020243 [Dioscorea zingiberensis]|uniref:Uncharacterized protein n=1 Tax=Dioscorea zingiberensis TaxID=325984 RepID=A0A9D5CG99_9LILI|nr:hypothetical protein J5N97_020243 [Dioscorea zingiberensis]
MITTAEEPLAVDTEEHCQQMPLLELSKTLVHHVSYLATPRNISRLSSTISTTLPSLLTVIPLILSHPPGLTDLAEATSDISQAQVQYLKLALDSLQHPFTTFLKKLLPNQTGFSTPWAIPIASKFSIPCAFFSVFTASFLTIIGPPSKLTEGKGSRGSPENFTVTPAWIPFPSKLAYSSTVQGI